MFVFLFRLGCMFVGGVDCFLRVFGVLLFFLLDVDFVFVGVIGCFLFFFLIFFVLVYFCISFILFMYLLFVNFLYIVDVIYDNILLEDNYVVLEF